MVSLALSGRVKGVTGKEIWGEVIKSISDDYPNIVYPILNRAYRLLEQAVAVYDVNAYEAVALMCRATLEAALLDFLTLEWEPGGDTVVSKTPLTLGRNVRRVDYGELQDAMEKRGLLSGRKKDVERIRADGNFTAHIADLQKRSYNVWFGHMLKIELKFRTEGGSIGEKMRAYAELGKKLDKKHMIWISKDRALQNLQDTASLFLTIAQAIRRPAKN